MAAPGGALQSEQYAERSRRRHAAAVALDAARSGSDLHALRYAIDVAVEAGVGAEIVGPARQRKAALQKAAERPQAILLMSRRLESAMAVADRAVLASVLAAAEKLGVEEDLIARARAKLSSLTDELRRRVLVTDATRALEQAAGSGCVAAFVDASAAARKAGVHEATIAQAERQHATSTARRQRQHYDGAARNLESVTLGRDLEALVPAIELAVEAGLSEDSVQPARRLQAALEEEKRAADACSEAVAGVEAAMEGDCLSRLREAIAAAEKTGVAADKLGCAKARVLVLEDEVRRRDVAEQARALLRAVVSESGTSVNPIGELGDAIAQATRAGVGPEELSLARERLSVLQGREALEALAASENLEALHHEIVRAQTDAALRAVCGEALLQRACEKRAQLEATRFLEIQEQATCELERAISTGSVSRLASAIKKAEASAVNDGLLDVARSRLQLVEADARRQLAKWEATVALQASMDGDDAEAVSDALAVAESNNVDLELLERAVKRRAVLVSQSKQRSVCCVASNVLEAAVRGGSLDALTSAIQWGSAVGVRADLLARGSRRQEELEDAALQRGEVTSHHHHHRAQSALSERRERSAMEVEHVLDEVRRTQLQLTSQRSAQQEARGVADAGLDAELQDVLDVILLPSEPAGEDVLEVEEVGSEQEGSEHDCRLARQVKRIRPAVLGR
eukprot:TRINITY_DN55301_c0_g1_i1.p1 TRINITY_DN55301_c0_g1~~TRINITY_DN55301_c0_g1_i1.p1  ORF type:complete len:731 (-),score=180.55 TRINITY_DN55301_c0_g1_i1:265-2331(-)